MWTSYVATDCVNPYRNLAVEEALVEGVNDDEKILFLWQNAYTIVVGKNQDVQSECRAGKFVKAGGRIARRRSGGGAVFHDLGNLNFSFIGRKNEWNDCYDLIRDVLEFFSVKIAFNGRNDFLVDGRKFSGMAEYCKNGVMCRHGTLLVEADVKQMAYFLTPDKSKLDRNHVRSVASRVVNLSELQVDITVDTLRRMMIEASNAKRREQMPTERAIEQMEKIYKSSAWIYGGKR